MRSRDGIEPQNNALCVCLLYAHTLHVVCGVVYLATDKDEIRKCSLVFFLPFFSVHFEKQTNSIFLILVIIHGAKCTGKELFERIHSISEML